MDLQKKLTGSLRPKCTRAKKKLEMIAAKYGEENPRYIKASEDLEKLLQEKEELENRLKNPS